MKTKYLCLLLAAILMGQTPALAKEKKEKTKTEQTKQGKKGKSSSNRYNKQLYTLTCKRGDLVLDANGKPIKGVPINFAVNNKIYNKTTNDKGGFDPYKLNMIRAGRYTMAFYFAGNDNYTGAFASVCVDLDKKPIKIKASAKSYKAATKTKKYTVTLSTKVCSSHDGKAHLRTGLKVTLTVNGKTFTGKTNSKGQVTFKITNLSKKAKYKAKVSYEGDATYDSASKTVTLTVN